MTHMQEQERIEPAPTVEYCYRHPRVQTGVHCTRCDRPICPDCMIPAPVGYQCPECVAQARREFRQGPGRFGRRTARGLSATKLLLAAIGLVFVVEIAAGGTANVLGGPGERSLVELGALQPYLIANGQYWRLFTAMFLHAGLLHIAFNAYALWLFGQFVESTFGTRRMLLIFFVSGFLASVASYAFGPPQTVGVGASGAIFGIFGAFVAYHFRRRELAASAASLRWAMTMILLNAFLAFSIRGIDWRAHLGGLVGGFLIGTAIEGFGPRRTRALVSVLGVGVLIVVGIGLVLWRTDQIRSLPEFRLAVGFFSS